MKTILITGATGFVGSALAANLLARSVQVIALVRNDPNGERTRAAIRSAAEGFGLDFAESLLERNLRVLESDEDTPCRNLTPDYLAEISEVWHVAAEMSFSIDRLEESLRTNVSTTIALYQCMAKFATKCKRFYYVSTAYVAGIAGGKVAETLNFSSECINPYQLSKRCAEQSLALLSAHGVLPVTIFRPTVIVGHETTGWAKSDFGFYMYVKIIKALQQAGVQTIKFQLNDSTRLDFIPVNRLVDQAIALSERQSAPCLLEIFHCSNGLGKTMAEIVSFIGRFFGVVVSYGPPETIIEQQVAKAFEDIAPHLEIEWHFDRSCLDQALGHAYTCSPMEDVVMERLLNGY